MKKFIFQFILLLLVLSTISIAFAEDTILLPEDAEHFGGGGIIFDTENEGILIIGNERSLLRTSIPYDGPVSDGQVSGYLHAYYSTDGNGVTWVNSDYKPDTSQYGRAYTICGGVPYNNGPNVSGGQVSHSACIDRYCTHRPAWLLKVDRA